MAWGGGLLLPLLCVAIVSMLKFAEGDVSKAVFIFGDSTADVGTNNGLSGVEKPAKANFAYNGIDYPNSKPTGRFSNGYNTIDSILRLLGEYKESPPPFLTLVKQGPVFDRGILRGANFASGGSGICTASGKARFGPVISLGEQIKQFETARKYFTQLLGAAKSQQFISNSTFIISTGTNDLVDYQLTPSGLTPQAFIKNITDTYAIHLQQLYVLGARKFGIISVPSIGCCPVERFLNGSGGCSQNINDLAQAFYPSMKSMLQNFSSQYQGVNYSLGNAYQMTMNLINNASASGFKDVTTACCGAGISGCDNTGGLCESRDDHLFWDWVHPTQAASILAAKILVSDEGSELVTPINFGCLSAI